MMGLRNVFEIFLPLVFILTISCQDISFPDTSKDKIFRICEEESGRLGYCTRISICQEVKNRTNPKICGFVHGEPVICCLYNLGVDPLACKVADGRPGKCVPKDKCPSSVRDYIGFTDDSFCIEDGSFCCPLIGNSVEKSVDALCAKGRGSESDYFFPTCGDTQVWGKRNIKTVLDGNVNKAYERLLSEGASISNVASSRGIIKSFVYTSENGTKYKEHYIDDIGSQYCFVLVRGIDAGYSITKYMALLGSRDNKTGNISWFCDGIVINYDWILTAAHCPNAKRVDVIRLGEHTYNSDDDDIVPRDYLVDRVIIHPDYSPPSAYHDLALIKLNETIIYHPGVTPICLPWGWDHDFFSGDAKIFTVSGWGATSFLGGGHPVLQEADLVLTDINDCAKNYSTLPFYDIRWPNGMSSNNSLCASDPTLSGRDACSGDSGGPLVYRYKGAYVLGGVVSLGYGCGNPEFPGVYVPIYEKHYLNWINEIAFTDACSSRRFYESTMTCFYGDGIL